MNTGLILNESAEVYHESAAIGSSALATMRIAGNSCPANFYAHHVAKTVPKKDEDHFRQGTTAHLVILEGPEKYNKQCVVEPATYTNEKNEVKAWHNGANVCKAWRAGCAGKIILSQAEVDLNAAMSAAIANHDVARALTARGQPEVTFRKAFGGGIVLQCRVDKWHSDSATIVDLKTCENLERFERDFYFLRYNFKSAFYRLVVAEVLADMAGMPVSEIDTPNYKFVVVEKKAPFRVAVYTPDDASLEAGIREVHADLTTLRSCMADGKWPTGFEEPRTIGLNSWQLAKSYEASDAAINA